MPSNLYVSAAGAVARMTQLDLVANNLANTGTTGFKRDAAHFESVLRASLRDEEGEPISGAPGLEFVRSTGIASDFEAGSIQRTDAPMDVAIVGAGFLEIQTEQGLRYTRAGSLMVDSAGTLTTKDGKAVMGADGPIQVTGSGVRIQPSGELQDGAGNVLGRLKVVEFQNPLVLKKEGRQRYEAPEEAGPLTAQSPQFITQSLESSNVNSVSELSTMVILQRAFDANIKTMQADDEATSRLIREIQG
ncbi:MAG: flagellar basal-body rod protein FlgF [bacterium]|nr:flagellar basal-body rod protein FlgF [bacterium]